MKITDIIVVMDLLLLLLLLLDSPYMRSDMTNNACASCVVRLAEAPIVGA
jgi:hypothetical protein